jgi:molybdate transport system permease protein
MFLTDDEITVLLLSLRVAFTSMALLLVPGVLIGWLLARGRFPGKHALDVVVHLPLVLPPVVTGYLLLLLFGLHGLLGPILERWFGMRIAFT